MTLICGSATAQDIQFLNDTSPLNAPGGYIQLDWDGSDAESTYELQQSTNPDFKDAKTLYTGPDQASFVSGLASDTYYYRVRSNNDNWSETLVLQVQHQSLQLAYTLSGIGLFVFLLSAFVVIKGSYLKSDDQ